MKRLARCPFCGGKASLWDYGRAYSRFVECRDCSAKGPPVESAKEAIDAWNKRVLQDKANGKKK